MIFFDIDGTLIDHARASAAASVKFYDRFADRITFGRQDFPVIWENVLMNHFQRFTRGEISLWEQRRGRMREVFRDPGLTDAECDSRYRVFMEHYESLCEAYPDAAPCLQRLRGKELGIVSNGGREQQVGKLRRSGLLQYLSVLMFSEDVGVGKPASGIFLEACRQAGEQPAACAHVGDDRIADVPPVTHWECRRSGSTGSGLVTARFLRCESRRCRIWSLYLAETFARNRLLRHWQKDLYHRGHRTSQGRPSFRIHFWPQG